MAPPVHGHHRLVEQIVAVGGQNMIAQDFPTFGGSLSAAHGENICKIMAMAANVGAPVIGLNDSGGARIQEGVASLGGYAEVFWRNAQASGNIPQISVIMGPCAGGAVYSPAMTDFIYMVKDSSYMFVTGPDVVKTVTNEIVSAEELGGASTHTKKSSVADAAFENDIETLLEVRRLFDFLPLSAAQKPPFRNSDDCVDKIDESLDNIIPDNANQPYDMHEVIKRIVDRGDFLELKSEYAKNIIVGLGRLGGRSVGIVANNPLVMDGALDFRATEKEARFVRYCDAFNVPLLFLVDTPGFIADPRQEHEGLARHAAMASYAVCEATVPKITMYVGRCYNNAQMAMGTRLMGVDAVLEKPVRLASFVATVGKLADLELS